MSPVRHTHTCAEGRRTQSTLVSTHTHTHRANFANACTTSTRALRGFEDVWEAVDTRRGCLEALAGAAGKLHAVIGARHVHGKGRQGHEWSWLLIDIHAARHGHNLCVVDLPIRAVQASKRRNLACCKGKGKVGDECRSRQGAMEEGKGGGPTLITGLDEHDGLRPVVERDQGHHQGSHTQQAHVALATAA